MYKFFNEFRVVFTPQSAGTAPFLIAAALNVAFSFAALFGIFFVAAWGWTKGTLFGMGF